MLIEILDDRLIIKEIPIGSESKLISQLSFWGFTEQADCSIWERPLNDVEIVLPKLIRFLDKLSITYRLSESSQQILNSIKQSHEEFEHIKFLSDSFKEGEFNEEDFREFFSFLTNHVPRKLKDHQVKAAFHLYISQNGANFSVPGAGKTSVVLSVYEKMVSEGKVNVLFVVGPTACFYPWIDEFRETLGRQPVARILAGGDKSIRKSYYFKFTKDRPELYLTTFQTLLNDQDEVVTFLNHKTTKAFFVIDEAHYIKQIGGSWADAALHISKYAKYHCVLTGTPLPKGYPDLYNLFDFLWPKNNPIDSMTRTRIEILQDGSGGKIVKEILDEKIGPLFYRVRKSDLGLLPQVFHDPYVILMNKYEKEIYDAIINKIRHYSQEDYLRDYQTLSRLMRGRMIRCRQAVSYPKLLLTAIQDYDEDFIAQESPLARIISDYDALEVPAKLDFLTKLIQDFQEKRLKVVVWVHFIGSLKLIIRRLRQLGLACKAIYGEIPIEETPLREVETREKIRLEFVDPNSGLDILVANPAAAGESVSLHKTCFNAIYYDLSYNCAQYLQSLDRIHRVGGSEEHTAHYYFIQYENTIEHDITENLELKRKRMYDIIERDYSIYSLDMFETDDSEEIYEKLFHVDR